MPTYGQFDVKAYAGVATPTIAVVVATASPKTNLLDFILFTPVYFQFKFILNQNIYILYHG